MSARTSALFFLIVCFLLCACSAQKIIRAELGQNMVILPCKDPNNIIIEAVEWIRPDQDPDYVLYYRDGHIDQHNQHPSYQNRVDLQDKDMKNGYASLVLKNVKMEDTGTYMCRVFVDGNNELISIINLEVHLSGQEIITAELGQDVILPCKVPNKNIRVVEWIRPDQEGECVIFYWIGHINPDNQNPSYQNRVDLQDKDMKDGNVSLILKNVKMEDTGTYMCRVFEKGNNEPISNISLEVRPSGQEIITAELGQDVILPCKVPNKYNNFRAVEWSRPDLDPDYVLFYRNGRIDPDIQNPSYQNRVDLQDKDMKNGDASLVLMNVKMEDTGTYMCRVFVDGNNEPISIINLEVRPSGQTNITAELEKYVILPCKVPNNNIIIFNNFRAVEWIRPELDPEYVLLYRNGRIDPDIQHPSYQNRVDLQDRKMKDGDASLILMNVKMEDTGKYMCRIFVDGNNDPLCIINLEVRPSDQEKISAELGQDVILPCKVPNKYNNNNIAVEWSRPDLDPDYVLVYRNGRIDPDNQHPSSQNRVDLQDKNMKNGDASLVLMNVKMEDTGRYMCRVFEKGNNELISNTYVEVHLSGEKFEGGKDGLIVGPIVGVILLLLLAALGSVGFLIYKRSMVQNQHIEVPLDERPVS